MIGYWFRFGRSGKTLHLVKYAKTDDGGVSFESACGAATMPDREGLLPEHLNIPTTARAALDAADQNQRAHLCIRCPARVMRTG